jgi:hypothetical protein
VNSKGGVNEIKLNLQKLGLGSSMLRIFSIYSFEEIKHRQVEILSD